MANGKKVKSKATKGTGAKKRTAADGSGTGMSLKKTMKRVPSDGGRPQVMAQKKGGQGKRMTRTITSRTAPRGAARGATIGATEGMSSIPFRNSFIERVISRQQN